MFVQYCYYSLVFSTDVNECEMGIAKCIPDAICQNSFGLYRCRCNNNSTDCTGNCIKDNQRMNDTESMLFGPGRCDNCTCNVSTIVVLAVLLF